MSVIVGTDSVGPVAHTILVVDSYVDAQWNNGSLKLFVLTFTLVSIYPFS